MYILHVASQEHTYRFCKGATLLEILQAHGLRIEKPCAGKGTCGKCQVTILAGDVTPPTEEERAHLTAEELSQGIRLSCQVMPEGDVKVGLFDKTDEKHTILTDGYMPELKTAPLVSKKVCQVSKPTLENNASYQDLLEESLGSPIASNDPSLLIRLPEILREGQVTAVYSGEHLIGLEAGDTGGQMYGIAADIGTTTVVVSLVDLITCRELGCETALNPQQDYGLDVLSRIDFVKRTDHGLKMLHTAIIDCLNQLTAELCRRHQIPTDTVYEMTVAANATMMHLLLGVDTHAIGRAPFATVFSKSQYVIAKSVGLNVSPFARLYCLPGVSSFIGADIVAGVAVSQLKETKKNSLFIDIGTNCELVLSKSGDLSSCSCAAGPALEGMNISCGMRASEGAIEGVKITETGIVINVIGDTVPAGVCGSGILEAVSEISRVGLMGKTGRLKKKEDLESDDRLKYLAHCLTEKNGKRELTIDSTAKEMVITQSDIRQIQLAKGAILSGICSLLESMEITMDNLDEVIIAGQFGKHLSVDSLVGVGIISEQLKGKITYIGNASKTGALMCLLSGQTRQTMEKTAENIRYFELATQKGYERLFASCLTFN